MAATGKTVKRDLIARIRAYNEGREADRLAIKYQRMASSVLRFFRGTCHLFWEDWPKRHPLDAAPMGWACGDLHGENFGAFRGANGLVHFDLNDFDEGALAPITRDAVRLATSLLLSEAHPSKKSTALTNGLAGSFLDQWSEALIAGKPMWVERETAEGPVRELLELASQRTRRELLHSRTRKSKQVREILIDGKHALEADSSQLERAKTILAVAGEAEDRPGAFKLLAVARRIAGTGSLGVERYIGLVEGDGKPDGHWLVDIKQAVPSTLAASVAGRQPGWKSEAERVVAVQNRMQAVCPALLRAVKLGRDSYVLKELQPSDLKFDFTKTTDLKRILPVMGATLGFAQLRSSGRGGTAAVDELIQFAKGKRWRRQILDYAADYSQQVLQDYRTFLAAYEEQAFQPKD